MSGIRTVVVIVAAVLSQAACGSTTPPTVPSAPGPGPGTFANVSGTWTGTFASANLATRTITLTVSQGGNCVDGAWLSSPQEWSGAISGFADATSYSGQISFERAESGGRCSAVGNVSGEVGSTTLRWTGTGLTAVGACADPLPQSIVITLRRQ